MFHLIEFLINKTVAVVPQTWCRDGVVYWPNYRNDERVNRAVKNSEEPGPDWKTYDVRVIKTCDDYFEAQRLLKKSLMCNTSDLQSEEEEEEIRPKRRPKPIHFFGDTDNDSEEEGHPHKKRARGPAKLLTEPPAPVISPPAPVISTPPFIPSSSTPAPLPPTSPPPHCAQRPAEEQTPSTRKVYRPTWRGGRCGSDSITCSAAEVHIMSLLELIKHQQEQIIAKVNYLMSKVSPAGQDMEMPDNPVDFPLTSMEEVENFEEWLRNPANNQIKLSVISSLATVGGHDTKRVTWNILSRMFCDDVGRRINWKGVNGKKAFNQMESKKFLLCAVRKSHASRAATDDEITKHTIRWFNLAADRGSSRNRPTVSTQQ
ncbi:uncharacterized protein LOC125245788 isoform X3 [Megalobrama amblycephala]|nr:uncharacterized protein LOC125245788 isoform X3 [Megalobrama amblycephala]XP_048012496.1 uncharacterized protein LOC125245788 isoform X3 [Megalobrama amblycephala]